MSLVLIIVIDFIKVLEKKSVYLWWMDLCGYEDEIVGGICLEMLFLSFNLFLLLNNSC